MDMYVNPSERTIDEPSNDFIRQKPSAPGQTSSLEGQYITKDNIVPRESDDLYSSILGEVGSAGAGYNSSYPTNNDDSHAIIQAIMPHKEKPALKKRPSIGDAGSSTLGSPFTGQFFQTGGSDAITLGGPDNMNLNAGGGGGGLSLPYSRVNTRRYERIDRIAMKLFPIIFILFNVCYWSYYLLLHETFQELW